MDGATHDARTGGRAHVTPDRGPTVVWRSGAGRRAGPAISRRAFLAALAAGAGGGLGVLAVTAGRGRWAGTNPFQPTDATTGAATTASPILQVTDGATEVALVAQEVEWELAPGRRVPALAYNGQVPGPAIRVREGQRLRITLTNRLSAPTTIHWHGVDVPIAMDGVPDRPTPFVQPGETFVYEFVARPAGTRW